MRPFESGDSDLQLPYRVAAVSPGAAIGVGAVVGLVIGILVSIATDVPLAPEGGLLLGGLTGWASKHNRSVDGGAG